jgi:hypothetical protein
MYTGTVMPISSKETENGCLILSQTGIRQNMCSVLILKPQLVLILLDIGICSVQNANETAPHGQCTEICCLRTEETEKHHFDHILDWHWSEKPTTKPGLCSQERHQGDIRL